MATPRGAPPCPKETAPGCTYNPHAPQNPGGFLYLDIFGEKVDVKNCCGEIMMCIVKMSKKSTNGVTANVLGPSKPS